MNFRALAATTVLASVAAAPVLAQKLDEPAPDPAPVITQSAPIAPWAGGYAGAQLGFGYADTDDSGVDTNNDGVADRLQTTVENIGEDGDGVIGGLHTGYLWQNESFVYGAEADYDFADVELDGDAGSIDGLGRIKGKAGYAFGRALVYGTAGAVYGTADLAGEDYNDWGWTAGIGAETYVSENVTVGAEVLYNEFDEFDDSNVDVSATTVTARVSYRF